MRTILKNIFSGEGIRLILHKVKKVFGVLRREGIAGVRNRLRLSLEYFSTVQFASSAPSNAGQGASEPFTSPARRFIGSNGIPADSYVSRYEDDLDFSDKKTDIKALAFYLPQFHTFPENDKWWGKGFTEWTNTRKARPRYPSHYQPRSPHPDIGYYDLTDYRVLQQQADMVNKHGLYGLCIYHYWFSGKRLMEKPVDLLLAHPEIQLRFCLCWANEDWTRAWDGLTQEVLIAQHHENDDVDYIKDLKKYVMDPRYIRIDGEPVVLIYRPGGLPDAAKTFKLWREWAMENGIGPIRIWVVRGCTTDAGSVWVEGADAEVEFPPAYCAGLPALKRTSNGSQIFNYPGYVNDLISGRGVVEQYPHPVYRGAMLGWDCTPRRKVFHSWYGFSPEWYYRWLRYNIEFTRKKHAPDERFIFINAWNEWAEGTYLEPDRLFGYTNLNTTSKALFDMPLSYPISKEEDMKNVAESRLFDRQWYLKKFRDVAASGMDPLEHFVVAGWREGRSASEYFPSALYLFFNPGARQNPYSLISDMKSKERGGKYLDSLVERFEARKAETCARLKLRRIMPPEYAGDLPERKIAVHLHCFYDDMVPEICEQLNMMPCRFDLMVSVPKGRDPMIPFGELKQEFRRRLPLLGTVFIEQVPNRGRDIAPMLCTFGKRLMGYDYICHIHTKKSLHTPAHSIWAKFIYSHLFGSRERVSRLLGLLEKDAGLIFPPDFLMMREEPSGWGSNIAYAQQLLDRAHVDINLRRDFPIIEFPQGSMYWAKTAYLKPMFELDLKYEDFPPEPLGMDGSIAHGVERLLLLWGLERPEKVYQVFAEDEADLMDRKRYWYKPLDEDPGKR